MPVADADLRDALAGALRRPVLALARRPGAYGSSYAIEDLDVTLDRRAAPLRVVFKDMASGASGAREIEAYREVLGPAAIDAPDLYGAVGGWLFLEYVDGVPLWQVGDDSVWEEAARWLAALHCGGAPERVSRHLTCYDAAWFRRWLPRARELTPPGALDRLADGWERVVERLAAWPRTFVHGEFYASNVLVQPHARIRPVDWEMAGAGPGLVDVAALVAGWPPADRERLALAYLDALPAAGRPSRDDFLDALAHCRLYEAVKWLGWSAGWSPPPEHARDWLADALEAADEVGL